MHWEEIYARLAADREDAQAWAALRQRVATWARANLRGRGADLIADAVADVCAQVAVAFDRAHGPATFGGFVLGHCLNARRQLVQARRVALASLDDLDVPAPESDAPRIDPDEVQWLRQALHDLPDRERRAVVLRYFEELSAAQIALAIGVSEVNARRIVFNGLKRLRDRLACERRSNSQARASTLVAGQAPNPDWRHSW